MHLEILNNNKQFFCDLFSSFSMCVFSHYSITLLLVTVLLVLVTYPYETNVNSGTEQTAIQYKIFLMFVGALKGDQTLTWKILGYICL